MKILINYADDKYKKAQKVNSWTGKHIAKFDKVYSFGPEDIDIEYKEKHKDIFSFKRGNGLWLWKPYFINRVLNQCNDGDYLFYVDSGSFFLRNTDEVIKSFRIGESIWISDNPTIESCFTKPECFKKMNCDSDEIKYSNQIQATYIFLICCDESKKFIHEWLSNCEKLSLMEPLGSLDILTDVENGFVAHREDQSILSLLCKKNGIRTHKDPSQRGKYPETFYNERYAYKVPSHPDDKYKPLVFLHKSPTVSILHCAKLIVKSFIAVVKVRTKGF